MRRLDFPANSQFPDATPEGRYVVGIRDQHLETNAGRIPLPPYGAGGGQNLLYPRLGPAPVFAGGGNQDDRIWEWGGSAWVARGASSGMHPAIYDATGILHMSELTPMGYRYIDDAGHIVGCEETYRDVAHGIYEWTALGGITAGQGPDDGLILLAGEKRYRAADGEVRFVNFTRSGDQLALAWHTVLPGSKTEAHLLWLTVDELALLPEDDWAPPVPPPDPVIHVFDVQPREGLAPLDVHGHLEGENIYTVRWVDNEVISKPDDMTDHLYQGLPVGDHQLYARTANSIGKTAISPILPVTVHAPPALTYWPGVVCWAGQETVETYRILYGKGWRAIRLVCPHCPVDQLAAAIAVPQAAGLRVVAMIWPPSQVAGIPDGLDVEVGNEPDIGDDDINEPKLTPAAYAAAILNIVGEARRKHLTLWAGAVSNTDLMPLSWLRAMLALLPADINASVHRYPETFGDPPSKPRKAYSSRAAEMAAVKGVTRGRRLLVSETSYPDGKEHHGWWIFGHWVKVTEAQQAAWTREELGLWKAAGAEIVTDYQENDPPGQVDGFGIRDGNGRWKAVSDAARS